MSKVCLIPDASMTDSLYRMKNLQNLMPDPTTSHWCIYPSETLTGIREKKKNKERKIDKKYLYSVFL